MADTPVFHWADYLVFAITLLLSSAIGVYYAYKDRKRCDMEEYLVGGRRMSVLPVTISLFVSYVSAISYLGDPVEAYYYGWVFMALGLGNALAMTVVAHFFAPLYHDAHIISVYEISWLVFVLYAPSLALSQVSGLPVWATITIIGVVSTFYTALGGVKAVLWADTAQTVVMMAGLVAVLVRGCMMVGGLDDIWRIAKEDDRFNLNFSPSPLVRSTFWTYLVGGFFRALGPYTIGQYMTQRYCCLKTAKDARRAVYWNLPMFFIVVPLFALVGQLMYAYYRNCDPLLEGRIKRSDQMLPLMMVETLGEFPGLPGLFLAATCSASLSSLSSGQSAIVACVIRDFIEPTCGRRRNTPHFRLPDKKANIIAKATVVLCGVLLTGLACLAMAVGGIIFQMNLKFTSVFTGPMLGIFILAMFCPFVTSLSSFIGAIATYPLVAWIALGSAIHPPPDSRLPLSMDGCYGNMTTQTTTQAMPAYNENRNMYIVSADNIYSLSPLLLTPLGTSCTMCIALCITGVLVCIRALQRTRGRRSSRDKITDPEEKQELERLKNESEVPA